MIFFILRCPRSPCLFTLAKSPLPSTEASFVIVIWGYDFIKVFPLVSCRFSSHHCSSFLVSPVKTIIESKFFIFASSAICFLWIAWYWRGAANNAMAVEERLNTCVISLLGWLALWNNFVLYFLGKWYLLF